MQYKVVVGVYFSYFWADVTWVLCELELTIDKVKVSTTPDGKVVDLFFVTDTRFYILEIYFHQRSIRYLRILYECFIFIMRLHMMLLFCFFKRLYSVNFM